jgi:hypothetical protein
MYMSNLFLTLSACGPITTLGQARKSCSYHLYARLNRNKKSVIIPTCLVYRYSNSLLSHLPEQLQRSLATASLSFRWRERGCLLSFVQPTSIDRRGARRHDRVEGTYLLEVFQKLFQLGAHTISDIPYLLIYT